MRYLTLVRHAKSSWKDAGASDFSRVLNERGERDLLRVGDLFAGLPSPPDHVVASPAVRVRATVAGILVAFPEWVARVAFEPRIYEACVSDILAIVGGFAAMAGHVMVVGHNPALEAVAGLLVPGHIDSMPTLGVVCIESEAVTWDTLVMAPARLRFFACPKGLK